MCWLKVLWHFFLIDMKKVTEQYQEYKMDALIQAIEAYSALLSKNSRNIHQRSNRIFQFLLLVLLFLQHPYVIDWGQSNYNTFVFIMNHHLNTSDVRKQLHPLSYRYHPQSWLYFYLFLKGLQIKGLGTSLNFKFKYYICILNIDPILYKIFKFIFKL